MHYVSHSNYFRSLDRLARTICDKPTLSVAIAGLSRFSLREVLNDDEIVLLYQHKGALGIIKHWAESGATVDADAIRADLNRRERYFVPQYVMKVNTPRYHARKECEFLRATFENFETPPEIKALGPDKVGEFQDFCDQEWSRYKDKPIDRFWAQVGVHFGVSINPKKVSYASNGDPVSVGDLGETELMEKICEGVESLRSHAESTELTGYLYAPAARLYSLAKEREVDEARRQALLELMKLKRAIKMLVFNFHRVELDMREELLSDELLEALGFLPCKACCRAR
jgi:hypothetical protein